MWSFHMPWSSHICLDCFVFDLRRSVVFVSSNDLCRLQNDQVFCQVISKRSVLSDRTFWVLSHVWSFYSALNSCTRKWHSAMIESTIKESWWWWSRESWWWMICADFKTIKSFVKWSQNDHVFSDRTFWDFFHVWSFYFVLNPCTRKWHSAVIESTIRETWWWSMKMINNWCDCLVDAFILFDFIVLFVFVELWSVCHDHHFLSVSLKLLCDLFLRTVCCERVHALLRMLCLLLSIVLHQCLSRRIDDVVVVCLSFVEMSEL